MMRQMKRVCLLLALVLSVFLLSGCGSMPVLTAPEGDQPSLVFGHINMSEAPSGLGWVQMRRLRPITPGNYNFWVLDDGTFFRINVPPGTYKFTKFGGSSFWRNANFEYSFPDQGKGQLDRRISKKGIYYVGSYKYVEVETGWLEPGEFDLVKTKAPTERELLQNILPYSEHEYWIRIIEARIKQLKN